MRCGGRLFEKKERRVQKKQKQKNENEYIF